MFRHDDHKAHLCALADAGRKRHMIAATGRDFSSNDYLALSTAPEMRTILMDAIESGVPHGSGGSRLLRGNHPAHEQLETFAAEHYGSETALYFSSGFAANSALFSTLPQLGDIIIYDEYVHASAHEGMRMSRAHATAVRHNDMQAFADAIAGYRSSGGKGRIWMSVESLYSMDGDFAPLNALARLADMHDAMLIIDEAHATGVFGSGGRGLTDNLASRENIITLHTCGKALGGEGGLLCLPAILRDFMINRARSFIFSTAPSPLMAVLSRGAIQHISHAPALQDELHALITHAQIRMGRYCRAASKGSQIFPIIIGDDQAAMVIAKTLQADGFDVRGIRPPTIAEGTARLRISISRNINIADIDALSDRLETVADKFLREGKCT